MNNDHRTTAERPPFDLVAVRRDLAAARRRVRTLTAALVKTGGQELFAADPASLTARLHDAQRAVHDCEAHLRPGGAHLTVVPDSSALTVDPLPSVAALLDQWQDAHTIATGQTRPRGTGPMHAQTQVRFRDATQRGHRLRAALAMLPSAHGGVFAAAIEVTERQQAYELDLLHYLEDPAHPAAVALRAWEGLHPNADRVEAETRAALDAAVTGWALGRGRAFMPALPPSISSADRQVWVEASATQLAYRERYDITDTSPLGTEPWPEEQARAWREARTELARVGVSVAGATGVAVTGPSPSKRRSLNAALAVTG